MPLFRLKEMLVVAAWYVAVLSIVGLLGYLIGRLSGRIMWSVMMALGTIILSAPFIVRKLARNIIDMVSRPFPIAIVILGIYLFNTLLRFRLDRHMAERILPLCVLTVFSFFLLSRIILRVNVYHYGFALAMPAALLIVMAALYQVPSALGKITGSPEFIKSALLLLIGVTLIADVSISKDHYELKTYAVGSGGDMIMGWAPYVFNHDFAVNAALREIKNTVKPGETFVAFPEMVILNYLSRRRSAHRCLEYIPPFVEMLGEAEIVGSFTRNTPDYIVLVNRDTREYGRKKFGIDYGKKIFDWIRENYVCAVCVRPIGARPIQKNFLTVIIARRTKKEI